MVITDRSTILSGCSMCGADDDVAPIFPRDEDEYAIASDPSKVEIAPKTAFDTQASAVASRRSWLVGLGIGIVALGVVGAVYMISKRV